MHNPHDRFFRHVFSEPRHAAGELQAVLPAELSRRIDWRTLELVPESHVDARLSDLRSDVLFTAKLGERDVLLYLLLEHQSSREPRMALKLLGYMVRIWESYLRRHPKAKKLPVIVPAVVYHGKSRWKQAVCFGELLELDTELGAVLGRHVPDFEFRLDDLSEARVEELRARSMTALSQLALFCLRRARLAGNLAPELEELWMDRMREVSEAADGVAAFQALLSYIWEASETSPEQMRELVRQLGSRAEEAFMTGAQILRAEGEAKGKAEGEAKGKAETLLRLLELKFGKPNEATVERVQTAKMQELDRWVERILSASSLDDVFAG